MNSPLELFNKNIESIRKLSEIYNLIVSNNVVKKIDAEEILRAEIVLVVSAFDTFMHDLVREKIVNSFFEDSYEEIDFTKVDVTGECLKKIFEAKTSNEKKIILTEEIRRLHSLNSYQSPKSVEYAIGILNIKKIWSKLAEKFQSIPKYSVYNGENIKRELSLIIDRRNKIAHESDYNPINYEKYAIERSDVDTVLDFTITLVNSINEICIEEIDVEEENK
jgi:hypothetical protein